jgi:hypothetical protein
MQASDAADCVGDFEIDGEDRALLPPGNYQAHFVGWWTGIMFGRQPKLALTFKILTSGQYFGKCVSKWYNAKQLIGKHGKSGRFRVGRHSDFLADYARLVGIPNRTDRMSMTALRSMVLSVNVKTVEFNRRQAPIAVALRYSVIAKLVQVEAGAQSS